ncbi:MAG: hypothetical protein L3J29_01900 [Cyclobacteriaceae bacterium]|nr:hypothetical protein [Cyclobacteriaceae bacterium]
MNSKLTTLTLLILLYLTRISFAQDYNKTRTYKNNNGVSNTELEYRGKIIFTDDETDVKSISPGGFLRFSKRSFGTKRLIVLEGESNGNIYREYKEGSKKIAFEPDGKRWMASVLPEIIRRTGIGAAERAKKFYARGGINALLTEISMLPTDYVKGIYYDAAFRLPELKTGEMALLIDDAGSQISSSYELSHILMDNATIYSKDKKALGAAIIAAGKVSSSYDQAKVYKYLLTKANLNDADKGMVIKNVRGISSSYDKSGVLQAIIKEELSSENIKLVVSEISYINSSYEQSKVLQSLIKNQSLENLEFETLLSTISNISSSYEQGKVLSQLVTTKRLSGEQIAIISKVSTSISSSYEKSKFLQSLISEQALSEPSINTILNVVSNISSNYEQSKVLQSIIESPNFAKSNFKNAIIQASKVSSSYEQSKILSKLIGLKTMPSEYMIPMIKAIDRVSSSYERSKLLQQLAPQLPENKEVRDVFYEAAESLSNDDYGKIMRSLRNQ